MSLRRKMDNELIDLSLKHVLKNWAHRSQPPLDGKSRLINSAMQNKSARSSNSLSKILGWISMSFRVNFNENYLESYKYIPYYSLPPVGIGLNFSQIENQMMA